MLMSALPRSIRSRRARRGALGAFGALAVGAALVFVVFVVGMRRKSRSVQRVVRRMNRAVWNPGTLRTAGEAGAAASVVHHIGRRTGRPYDTPVAPVVDGDDIVVPLPYGTDADWVRNVLAGGGATITHDGEQFSVERPEIVSITEVDDRFDSAHRAAHRAFRVDECLRLHRVAAD